LIAGISLKTIQFHLKDIEFKLFFPQSKGLHFSGVGTSPCSVALDSMALKAPAHNAASKVTQKSKFMLLWC
jgi:hypothetical protein